MLLSQSYCLIIAFIVLRLSTASALTFILSPKHNLCTTVMFTFDKLPHQQEVDNRHIFLVYKLLGINEL
jgi:hypothetical protein